MNLQQAEILLRLSGVYRAQHLLGEKSVMQTAKREGWADGYRRVLAGMGQNHANLRWREFYRIVALVDEWE